MGHGPFSLRLGSLSEVYSIEILIFLVRSTCGQQGISLTMAMERLKIFGRQLKFLDKSGGGRRAAIAVRFEGAL